MLWFRCFRPVEGVLALLCSSRQPRSPVPVAVAVALLLGIVSPAVAQTPVVPTGALSPSPQAAAASAHPYAAHVAEAARRFGIPEAWIWSVMRVESAGNPTATSHAGAMGLMQVMPGTYAELRSRYWLGPDPYDRRDNILAGVAYLREMYDRYGPTGMLAAYNAGPGRWEDHLARGRPLPAETVAYMARLGAAVGGSAAPSPTVAAQVDRFAWRRAALFVALGESTSSGGPNARPVQPARVSEVAVDMTAVLPTDSATVSADVAGAGLFVVRRPE